MTCHLFGERAVRLANLLELRNISKVYSRGLFNAQSATALHDISLTLNENEPTILAIAGESGSGKTTLAMLLLGFVPSTTGQIVYRGRDISTLKGAERTPFGVKSRPYSRIPSPSSTRSTRSIIC